MNRGEKVRISCLVLAVILLATILVSVSVANGESAEIPQKSIETITIERDNFKLFTIISLALTVLVLIVVVVLYIKYHKEAQNRDYESEQYEKKSNEKLDRICALEGEVRSLKKKLETSKNVHEKEVKRLNEEIARLNKEISLREN